VVVRDEEEVEAAPEEPQKPINSWSQSDDLVLIENYPKFKELNKR